MPRFNITVPRQLDNGLWAVSESVQVNNKWFYLGSSYFSSEDAANKYAVDRLEVYNVKA